MCPQRFAAANSGSTVVALLGPTNTGKTHVALERMLQFRSGMIGLPLRLLAREIYDRLTAILGERAVALVTGEEKRIGSRARYFVCTVEAMPLDKPVDFLAVDEIQLVGHPERGHVFTQRLLEARGQHETWFMGSDTVASLIRKVIPGVQLQSRTRLSTLSGRGRLSIGRLPKRTAVIAFSVPEVFRLATALRHRKGGAAVVLGGFSPSARNAQIALYESGEVDYIVATDAIGMGLNLAIDHVAFSALSKFDGRQHRPLHLGEIGQIAGRAGRHSQSGTFGTLAPLPDFSRRALTLLEQHRFEPVRKLYWRNAHLDFASLHALRQSLQQRPALPWLVPVHHCSDARALSCLAEDPEILQRSSSQELTELLWAVCQIPDYGQQTSNLHNDLVRTVFGQLTSSAKALDQKWLEQSLGRLDNCDGDIDSLSARIASLRTYAYLCNQGSWLAPASRSLQTYCEEVELRLSNSLHTRLVDQFVDRGRSLKQRNGTGQRPQSGGSAPRSPESRFSAWSPSATETLQSIRAHLSPRTPLNDGHDHSKSAGWIDAIIDQETLPLRCSPTGALTWEGTEVGQLKRGQNRILPDATVSLLDLSPSQHLRLSRRLRAWSRDIVDALLEPLRRPRLHNLSPPCRGLLYELEQNLGVVPSGRVRDQLSLLTRQDRTELRRSRVRLTRQAVFCHPCCDTEWDSTRLALTVAFDPAAQHWIPPWPLPRVFRPGRPTASLSLNALGYLQIGPVAIRAPLLEGLAQRLAEASRLGAFPLPGSIATWLECDNTTLEAVLPAFGYCRGRDQLYRGGSRRRRRNRRKFEASQG